MAGVKKERCGTTKSREKKEESWELRRRSGYSKVKGLSVRYPATILNYAPVLEQLAIERNLKEKTRIILVHT